MRDIKDYDQNILSEQKRKKKKKKRKNEKQKEGESQWALDIQTNILPDEDKSIEKKFKKDASNNSTKKEML